MLLHTSAYTGEAAYQDVKKAACDISMGGSLST